MVVLVWFRDDAGMLSTVAVTVENARNARQAETMAADGLRADGYVVCRARSA